MTDVGFEYLEPPVETTDPPDFRGFDSRYGPISTEQRLQAYSGRGALSQPDLTNEPLEASPPSHAYLLALYGSESSESAPVLAPSGVQVGTFSPPGGCVAKGLASVFGSVESYQRMFSIFREADQFVADAHASIVEAAAHSTTLQAWSDCLYQSTGQRWTDPFAGYETHWDAVSIDDERIVFDADVACKWSSGLAEVMIAADTSTQNDAVEANPSLPDDVNKALQDLVNAIGS